MKVKEIIFEATDKPLSGTDLQAKNLVDQSQKLKQQAKLIRAKKKVQAAQNQLAKASQLPL